jgi:hypothetical protein
MSAAPVPASNDGKELVDAGYTRRVVALSAGTHSWWTNTAPFTFGPFANDVTVQGAAIYDATSGGNMLFGGVMGESMTFAAGQAFTFATGHLLLNLV